MSLPPAEERKLEHRKLDELAYIAFLLEWIAHKASPGNMDFGPFQGFIRGQHATQLRKE